MGTASTLYRIVLVAHLLAAVVGFGSVMLNGLYGLEAKRRRGAEGVAIAEANLKVSGVAEYVIYAVPVLGIALILLSDGAWEFSQAWISASFALYIAAVVVARLVMFKGANRIIELSRQMQSGPPPGGPGGGPPPQVAEIEAIGRRLGMVGGMLNLSVVGIVALMVFKPGA